MQTIALEEKWVQTVQLFGDTESIIKAALKAYSIEQCRQRIQKAAEKATVYAQKYQCEYEKFPYAIQSDENFLQKIEKQSPLWEEDAMEWKFWTEEQQTWQSRLETISQN